MTPACQPINRPARYLALYCAPPSPMFPGNVSDRQKLLILATMETKNEGWKQPAQKHSVEYQCYTVTRQGTFLEFMTKTATKVINVYGEGLFNPTPSLRGGTTKQSREKMGLFKMSSVYVSDINLEFRCLPRGEIASAVFAVRKYSLAMTGDRKKNTENAYKKLTN